MVVSLKQKRFISIQSNKRREETSYDFDNLVIKRFAFSVCGRLFQTLQICGGCGAFTTFEPSPGNIFS